MKKLIATVATIALSLGGLAHAQGEDEGLVKVDGAAFKETWVNPNVDVLQYDKIMVEPIAYDFKEVKKRMRIGGLTPSGASEFYIENRDRERAMDTINKVFNEAAEKSSLHFVNNAGDNTIALKVSLVDIVSHVPPENKFGMSEDYVTSVGAATIVIEGIDAKTGEVVYRAAERRKIQRGSRELFRANSVTVNAELRRHAKRMASKLITELELVHS